MSRAIVQPIEPVTLAPAALLLSNVADVKTFTNLESLQSEASLELAPAAIPSSETTSATPGLAELAENELAQKIDEKCLAVACLVDGVKTLTSLALQNALEAGQLLIEARRRAPDGGWLEWLKMHCPEVSRATAYRYIELAERFPHVRNGDSAESLRKAYILCGILPAPPVIKKKGQNLDATPAFTGTDLVARVKSIRVFYSAQLERFDCATLEASTRLQLKEEIGELLTQMTAFVERIGMDTTKPAKAMEIAPKTRRTKK